MAQEPSPAPCPLGAPTSRWPLVLALLAAVPLAAAADKRVVLCPTAMRWGMIGGKDGWVFSKPDLRTDFSLDPQVEAGLARVMHALADTGVHVEMVLWPLRPLVVPQVFVPPGPGEATYDRTAALAAYAKRKDWLVSQGVTVVDLYEPALGVTGDTGFYFRRDHHETAVGAQVAANAIATALRADPAWPGLPHTRYASTAGESVVRDAEGRGVLMQKACGVHIPVEPYVQWKTHPVDAAAGPGLLDEAGGPEVVYVGTSMGSSAYNLMGFLREAAETDVVPVLTPQGGVLGSLQSYLRSPDWQAHHPAVLVWEFALYELFRDELEGSPDPRDPSIYRQIVPSVYGDCGDAAILSGAAGPAAGEVPLFHTDASLSILGKDHYLFLSTDDPGLLHFDVVSRYADGKVDDYPITAATRAATYGRFFLDLRADFPAPLTSVSLRLPPGSKATLQARLCRAPAPQPAAPK